MLSLAEYSRCLRLSLHRDSGTSVNARTISYSTYPLYSLVSVDIFIYLLHRLLIQMTRGRKFDD